MRATGEPVLYRDRWIECTAEALVIHAYYFPWGSKRVRYDRIRGLEEFRMGVATGQWRVWGSGDFKHWFNFDPGRTRKTRGLVLDLGGFVRPVITPDDVDQVRKIIEERRTMHAAISSGRDTSASPAPRRL